MINPIAIKVPNIVATKLLSASRWSQFFRITGSDGVAYADQDVTLYTDFYANFLPSGLVSKGQYLAYDPSNGPGLWMPDVYNYFTWQITAGDAQTVQVLQATPPTLPFFVLTTGEDGNDWLYHPFFYLDRARAFFVQPSAEQPPPTTVSSQVAILPAPDSTAQIAKTWSNVNVSTTIVNLAIQTPSSGGGSGPASPYLLTLISPLTTLARPTTQTAFTFSTFYHPYVKDCLTNLNRDGIDGLYDPQPGQPGDGLRRQAESGDHFATTYQPSKWVTTPYPIDEFDFDPSGAYSIYNWELFFHAPFLIAMKLAADQQFDDALKWFHYIFNPTEPSAPGLSEPAPQRFWKVKPFYQLTGAETDAQSPIAILSLLLSTDDTDPARVAARQLLMSQVEQWRENPFDPDAVARLRPVAYMKAVVMRYLDMLIAWGDQLFSQATRESINEAIQIYVMALKVLGTKPTKLPAVATAALTYDDLAGSLDDFSDALVAIENVLPPVNDDITYSDTDDTPLDARSMYFCVPPNETLLGYWGTVEDRLTKIRNCLSITGQPLNLALFAPPIDPGLLIAATQAGIDIGSVLQDVSAPPPLQRYAVLAQRATELVGEVKSFGAALLSALEKKDAEALALLRGNQEIQLLSSQRIVKQWALQDAQDNLTAATAANDAANKRYNYYSSRTFTNEAEGLQLEAIGASAALRLVGSISQALASAIEPVPNADIGLSGWGGHCTTQFGGSTFGEALASVATTSTILAAASDSAGQAAGILGSFTRRQDDWQFQADLAKSDQDQTTAQIAMANDRINQANADLDAHDVQYQNALDARDFIRDKFTNEELYDWMSSQLSALYFQMYQVAYDAAKRAERAWQFELADDSTFINFGYWESARQGLLAGERLSFDVKRMEMAYLDRDVREIELTHHIPLTQLDEGALQLLRESGTCTIGLPEWLFDVDSPGHYLRRIKQVSLTIVGTTGPYTPVRCKLTLQSSQVRSSASLDPSALVSSSVPIQSIVTSTAQNDSGLFETNLRDERYLPFERAGAISTWELSLPTLWPAFDHRTIQDLVLHLRYTARDGGQTFHDAVVTSLTTTPPTWTIGFSVKSVFSDAWYQFLVGTGDTDLTLSLDADHIPFRSGTITITAITFLRVKVPPSGAFTDASGYPKLTAPDLSNPTLTPTSSWNGTGQYALSSPSTMTQTVGTWKLTCNPSAGTPVNFTDDDDLIAIITYTVT